MGIDDFWVDTRHGVLTPRSGACPDPWRECAALLSDRLARGLSAARLARSAVAVMLRSIPPNTTPWNGDMDRQYACPASPRGWKIARWL
jgi:hypothetical protein